MKLPTLLTCAILAFAAPALAQTRPNIVVILTDDLGYGDVSSYGASTIKTPNIDRLAKDGLRFTDAHSPAATCTPSRYALLTGEYAWRQPGTGILPGNAALDHRARAHHAALDAAQGRVRDGRSRQVAPGPWSAGRAGLEWRDHARPE